MDERPSLQMLMRRSWDRPTQRDWSEVLGCAAPLLSAAEAPRSHDRQAGLAH
jgi:hypothetical protein